MPACEGHTLHEKCITWRISGHTAVQPFLIHTGIKLLPECHPNKITFLVVRLKVHQRRNYSE